MSISIVVPQLGESVAEGTVSKWLKQVGERVRKEEPLVEIQTDKINVEIPSPSEGVLEAIVVQEGTTVLVGTEIGRLSGAGAAAVAAAAPAHAGAPPAASVPAVASPRPGTTPASAFAPASTAAPAAVALASDGAEEPRNLSPAVRRIMREQNVSAGEVAAIPGTGLAGRVTREDLMVWLQERTAAPGPVAAPAAGPLPAFAAPAMGGGATGPREEVVPFTKVRRLIAENMVRAKHTAAHTHCFDEADMTAIAALKRAWGPRLERQGIKLTYMPFFIKAAVLALHEHPWVNGEVRGETMVVKRHYNIGMAVGRGDKGLIVPNVKDCDRKTLAQIAAEVNDIAARARADRLKPDDIQGGTFSITNAGVFGAINSSPVINVPEVAILGVHRIVERAVVRDGQIVARPMMNASIGFDHRVIDGEIAVKFLRRVCELLEQPELLWFLV